MARKKEVEAEAAELLPEDAKEARVYELAFHLEPELSEVEAKRVYESLRTLTEEGGVVVAQGEPEKMQLAYTISRSENAGRRDFDAAYFCWIAYETTEEKHAAVIAAASAEKRIIRFLDIRTTKDEAKHSAEMHELRQKPAPEAPEEPVSDTELDAALENAAV